MADASDAADVKTDKSAALQICENVMPLLRKLLRSFDWAALDAATGNNALHEVCGYYTLNTEDEWPYQLAELLIARGVSVHEHNKEGRTPLLEYAYYNAAHAPGLANVLRLLLKHGSDLNAQDNEGNGLLHLLVKNKVAAGLEGLFSGSAAAGLDLALSNAKDQTATDVAAIQLAQLADSSADSLEKRIHRLMMAQTAMWTKIVRPVLLRCLEAALPVTDVATLALGYIDGSGLPFTTSAEAASDEEVEPAAAAAVAAQS